MKAQLLFTSTPNHQQPGVVHIYFFATSAPTLRNGGAEGTQKGADESGQTIKVWQSGMVVANAVVA
ncbi:uncharacterized protein EHS24_006453 [Apiotrichum porosum]|uniref:Uncharacterized protein n=1 Tax=Apiotrichum porosum TaxID=105984 RepID=A0A427Y1D9_9TREE|nr:uncharacterized protein EHS24_006453 [Apiotrichum porosum]RSH84909.1 hypothetical protein EHS24_006453 [Apiotrichum porosum]